MKYETRKFQACMNRFWDKNKDMNTTHIEQIIFHQ